MKISVIVFQLMFSTGYFDGIFSSLIESKGSKEVYQVLRRENHYKIVHSALPPLSKWLAVLKIKLLKLGPLGPQNAVMPARGGTLCHSSP